jgi:hypothetical protein
MSEMFLGDVASRRRLYLAAKPFHVGVDVDELAYPPALSYDLQASDGGRGQGFLSYAVLSHRCSGRWCLLRDVKPPGLDNRWSVDHIGTCATESYME